MARKIERIIDEIRHIPALFSVLGSPVSSATEFGRLRGQRGIENGCHGCHGCFGEDGSRTRSGHAAANLAMVRKVAVLKRTPGKESQVTERLKVGWDDEYLRTVLAGFPGD